MRQCEFKKRYDPDMDMYLTKHIDGEGITDVFKAVGRKIFGKTVKKAAKSAAKSAAKKKRRLQQQVNMLVRRLVIR